MANSLDYNKGSHLFVDVRLVHEAVENVEHAVDVPGLGVLLQLLDLISRPTLKLTSELDKRLELYGMENAGIKIDQHRRMTKDFTHRGGG